MIEVSVETQVMMSNRTEFECPQCNHRQMFYVASPIKCEDCKVSLPDLSAMRNDPKERLFYHFFIEKDMHGLLNR